MLYCRQHFFNMKIACLHSLLYTLLYFIPTTIVSHNNDHCITNNGLVFFPNLKYFPLIFSVCNFTLNLSLPGFI